MTLLNRFKLHVNWSTIVFILNLAFVDLLYCMIGIPHYSLMLVHKKWDWGANACKIFAYLENLLAYVEWLSLAMVSVSRYISLTNYGKSHVFTYRKYRNGLFAMIWIYGIVLLLPTNLKLLGEFGYDCYFGLCDIIPTEDENNPPFTAILYGIAFMIPCFITIISYGKILVFMTKSNKYLKESSSGYDYQ